MNQDSQRSQTNTLTGQVFEVVFRIGIVLLLLFLGFQIIFPFLHVVAWGAILAVALYPFYLRICKRMGNRRKLVGTLFIIISVGVLVVPSVMLVSNSVDSAQEVADHWQEGDIKVPPPNDQVKDWPVVGEKIHTIWSQASKDLEATARKFAPQFRNLAATITTKIASVGGTVLGFVLSLIISGVLMISGESCAGFANSLARRLAGASGEEFATLATNTVRSVALGVVGTAFIQAVLAAIGLVAMGVPLAAVWTFAVLLLAIMQLPPILILGPVAFFTFSTHSPVAATIFTVWCLVVSFSDGLLKPILLGRGVDIPMLVILLGALGGMVSGGIMGLFVGAVVLALIYKLGMAWLHGESVVHRENQEASPAPTASDGSAEAST